MKSRLLEHLDFIGAINEHPDWLLKANADSLTIMDILFLLPTLPGEMSTSNNHTEFYLVEEQ
ncbi:MAG: hypothetical protein DWQ07_03500 [Chloroflexi bacterium]|nr:MAG: hypothetical protein DWQ07_03500 [Chloroflexota bacterium]MBL1193433.1 hypothetical protein [Chloroflexota bacterium]